MGHGWFFRDFSASEADQRIQSWFRRGYVIFSDRYTQSTHLRRVEEADLPKAAASPVLSSGADIALHALAT